MSDPFDTLGVEPRFDLDDDVLRRRVIALSAESHPDRFTDPVDQAEAADRLSRINAAHRTLADPERRANALLARLGGPAPEDDKSLPPDLLMEMMEVREKLESAMSTEDAPAIAELRAFAESERTERLKVIAALFAAANRSESGQLGKAVRLELNALRYYERMLEQMPD